MSRSPYALLACLLVFLLCPSCGGGGGGDLLSLAGGQTGVTPPFSPPVDTGDEPPITTASGMTLEEEAFAKAVLTLVNTERVTRGLTPLGWHDDAAKVGYLHSVDMDVRDFFSHTNPDGLSPGDRIDAAGIVNSGWGENIAFGYSTPEDVFTGWMNSAGHRDNILNPAWTHLGIGLHDAGFPNLWWTQVFLRLP